MVKSGEAKTVLRMTVREIKKTFRRFFAIFVMAALGAGVFAGIHMAAPDFVNTVNEFYQESQVYDYRLTSSLSWDDTSIEEISKMERVLAAEGVWQADILIDVPGMEVPPVYRVHSLPGRVNKVSLTEGQLPDGPGECLVDASHHKGIKVGDTIKFSEQNTEESLKEFKIREFKVVGLADSPLYTTSERGETHIGSGKVTGFIVTDREAFAGALAAEVDVKLADRTRFMSDAYKEMMDAQRENWQQAVQTTAQAQAERMRNAAEAELKAAQDELAQKKKEVKKRLAPAKREMEKAKAQLDSISSNISAEEERLDQMEKDLEDLTDAIDEAREKYSNTKNEKKKKQRKEEYEQAKEDYKQAKEDLKTGREELKQRMYAIDEASNKYNKKMAAYNKAEAKHSKILVEPQKRVNDARIKLDSIKDPTTAVMERSADESYTTFENDFKLLDQLDRIFPALFLITGSLGCAALTAYWIRRRRETIGTLRSMGMSRTQITASSGIPAGLTALFGGAVGYVLGTVLIPRAIWYVYRSGGNNLDLEGKFSFWTLLVCLLLPLICVSAATLWASYRLLKEDILSLNAEEPPHEGKHLLLEHAPELWQGIPLKTAVALRHTFLYKKRLIAALIGLGLCTALAVTGLGINDSVSGISRAQYGNIQVADAEVTFTGGKQGDAPAVIMSGVTKIGGKAFSYVSDVRDVKVGAKNCRVHLMAPYEKGNINHFFILRDSKDHGLSLPKEGEALISRGFAKHQHLKKGDTIVLPAQNEDKQDVQLTIAGVFTNYIYDYLIVPPAALTETGGSADVNSLFVNFAKDSDVDLSQTALSSLGNVTSVTMARQYEQRVAPAMNQMRCVAWITVVFAALLAIWFMMEIAAADMRGRWRDWKVCRLLGYDSREMTQPLLIEHLLLTVMAAVIGLIAGCILCRRVVGRIVSEVFYIPPKVGMLSCLLVLVLLLILAVFIHRISRIYLGRRPGAGRRKKHNKNKKSKKMKKSKKPKKVKKKEEKSA